MSMVQYVTFHLDDAFFGINIVFANEINDEQVFTMIPGGRSYIQGLLNLRGDIVTMFDLRHRMGFPDEGRPERGMNLILKTETEVSRLDVPGDYRLPVGDDRIGLVVDRIGDIVTVDPEAVDNPPAVDRNRYDIRFITGVFQMEEHLLMLLDIERVVADDDEGAN